ncbi:MAG TPA: flagellar basal body L-ring protein FlgH [Chthonomonadaceae bacterium]|nr:flagellar basal body L-ring protein FlgH [Chthonomonadaceae bacterium]
MPHRHRLAPSRRRLLILGYALFALIDSIWLARSDSLFPVKQASQAQRGSSSASAASLYTDARAHNVGDPLIVVIAENTTAQSSASTKTAQDENVNINGGTGLLQRLFKSLTLSATNSRSANGTGQTTRSGTLTTTLSVLVKEVLPNGTLRVEGSRVIGFNRETQRVTFSGIVRPEDIGVDNTIPSNLVADVEVRYDGKGVVGDTQRPGILTRIFRFLFH